MKHLKHFLIFVIILVGGKIHAQVLEDLTAPSMPAATIIGTQINEISKPKSLKVLEATILNNFLDSNSNVLIPNNYAFEINPFMLSKRTNFDYMEYLDDSLKHNLWRNLSLSVASTNKFIINDTISCNALGFGGRTVILNGKVSQKIEKSYINIVDHYKSLKTSESQIRTMIGEYTDTVKCFNIDSLRHFLLTYKDFKITKVSRIINEVFVQLPDTTNIENIEDNFTDIFKEIFSAKALNEFKELIDCVKSERYGWRWEVDAAMALSFPTNDFNYSISPKYGVWSNLSYKPYKKEKFNDEDEVQVPRDFEFIGLVRWINNNDDFIDKFNPIDTIQFKTGSIFDIGIRAVLEFKKFTAEFEYIYRLNQNKEYVTVYEQEYSRTINDDTYKFVLNLNYNISDNIVFSYNIGKNFDMINSKGGNIISGFSLNFGFGGVKKDELLLKAINKIGFK
ncbi:MAG: hypothetical protein A2X08_10520 [Bacteroidetes bacterium GWA2_32_17]|nr:MAG: hypothetical protein A2X08_10520 [Bacteroidetes bacterium GWA2_32_17]